MLAFGPGQGAVVDELDTAGRGRRVRHGPFGDGTAAGVRAIDPGLLLVARSFGASGREQLSAVVLPAIRGQVQTEFRVAPGIAWVVLVPAEMLGVRSGLGYQILNARDRLAHDQVMAVIVVIGSIG